MYLRQVEKEQYVEKDYLGNKRGKVTHMKAFLTFTCNFKFFSFIQKLGWRNSLSLVSKNFCLITGGLILPKMRAVLVDWLVEVHQQFSMLQETLYLTVAILDRFLQKSASKIPRKSLQVCITYLTP